MRKKFSYLFLISFLGILTALPISADYVDQAEAPLSPEFLEWQRINSDNLQNDYRMFSDSGQNDFSAGYRPSPVNTSHLSENLPAAETKNNRVRLMRSAPMPSSYDLRTQNRLTPVKNQNPYGTCWTFGAMSAMESNYLTQHPTEKLDLSELHMAWFVYKDPTPGNSFTIHNINQYGKDPILDQGGNSTMSIAYLSRLAGAVSENSLPYDKAANMKSQSQNPNDYKPLLLRLAEARDIGSLAPNMSEAKRNEIINLIKKNIIDNGGVAASYYAGSGSNSPENSVTAYFDNSMGERIDHIVTLVGWDDNFDKNQFSTNSPNKNGAWIVRNSWGNTWGSNGGYFYISYEQYLGTVTSYIVKENINGIKHYGHDALGYTNHFGRTWAANVFKAESWNEGIKEIGFYTTDHKTSFDLYIFALGTETPTKPTPENINSPLYSKKSIQIDYAGYHTYELENLIPLSKDNYFSVIIKMHSDYEYPTAVETALTDFSDPVINAGESFFAKGDSEVLTPDMIWDDGKNGITFANSSIPTAMNACIKAFTVPLSIEGILIDSAKFPDNNFIDYVRENFDADKNNYLSDIEIENAKIINLSTKNISTLKGIEYLVNLENLDCSKNLISDLDLRYNTELQILNCSENKLKTLDLTANIKITANNLNAENQNISDTVKLSETFNDNDYKYKFELGDFFSDNDINRILNVKAANAVSTFNAETHTAEFQTMPSKIIYEYDTGVNNASMSVNVNVSGELKSVKPIIKTSKILPEGRILEFYDFNVVAKGTGSVTWKKTDGELPTGLKFSSSGKISGTPENAGEFNFTLSAQNSTGVTSSDFTIKILNAAPSISSNAIAQNATAGEDSFNIIFSAIKGTNLSWFGTGILPKGVSVENDEDIFRIYGVPSLIEAGKTFTYTVTASNDVDFARQTVTLNVKNVPPELNNIASNYEIETQKNTRIVLTVSKGTNIKWTSSGNLPSGLTGKIYGTGFKIEGIPEDSAVGKEFNYTVTVSNDVSFESKKFKISVLENENGSNIPEGQRVSLRDYLDSLTDEELAEMTTLIIPENVKDLSGLGDIDGLPTLDFSKNGIITEVNLDDNDSVENLILSSYSGVKILNVSKSCVKRIEAENSKLEELNIAGSPYIEYINICGTNVELLNVEKCIKLRVLKCSDSEIGSINLTGCVSLRDFECDGNRLARLDLEEFNFAEFSCFNQEALGWNFSRNMNFDDFIGNSLTSSSNYEVQASYIEKISNVQGYDAGGNRIPTEYDSETGKILFPSIPSKITYEYNTGFEDEIMDVTVIRESDYYESETDEEENEKDSGEGGGGCNIGFNFAMLGLLLGFFKPMRIFAAVIGACFGSFINVVAHRSVKNQKWWGNERSKCESCGHVLGFFELIPIISWLALRGKCKNCGEKISVRYIFVEILCAFLSLSIFLRWEISFASALCYAGTFGLVLNSLTDFETGDVFDAFAIFPGILGILIRIAGGKSAILDGLIGALIGFGIFAIIILISRGGMGWGDATFMAGMGAVLGMKFICLAFYIGIMTGGIFVIFMMLIGKLHWGKGESIPLVPFLSIGCFITMMFGVEIFEYLGKRFLNSEIFMISWPFF